MNVIPMGLTHAFERAMVTRSDVINVPIKAISLVVPSTTVVGVPLNPAAFGAAMTQIAGLYAKWRIKRLIVSYKGGYAGINGQVAFCVVDDVSTEGGSGAVPTNLYDIGVVRCSTVAPLADGAAEIEWRPQNKNWFYSFSNTGVDQRFTIPGTLYSQINSSGTFSNNIPLQLYAEVQFSGLVH